jgi:uncharacterized protein YrrD
MKRSLKELIGYTIQATDGEKGKVHDILFDDETWIIRYVEADLGTLFSRKRVLIPRFYLREPLWEEKKFPIVLTVEKIEKSPDIDFDMPVSRIYEKKLVEHYELEPYWPTNMAAYTGKESMFNPDIPHETTKKVIADDQIETSLRSFAEIWGYLINATDENFGHIEDFIIDDSDWQILYVVIDTKNIVPWSKQVMLPIELIDEINFLDKDVKINLPKDTIKNAPEYNPAMAINAEYEKVLYDFYGRKVIK